MSFDANKHLMQIKGKDYLQVAWRLVWFREECPVLQGWGIRTAPESITDQQAIFRAQIVDPEGRVVAEGTKSETPQGFADYIEKAETGAIGRALAMCGYGTQFCGEELDEGERLADSPLSWKADTPPARVRTGAEQPAAPANGDDPPDPMTAGWLHTWFLAHGFDATGWNRIKEECGLPGTGYDRMNATQLRKCYAAAAALVRESAEAERALAGEGAA